MSLLNQVLQDLEKRNIETESASNDFKLTNIKAVSAATTKLSLALLLVITLSIVLAILTYYYFQAQDSAAELPFIQPTIAKTKNKIKPSILAKTGQQDVTPTIETKQKIQNKVVHPVTAVQKLAISKPVATKTSTKTKAPKIEKEIIKTAPAISNKQKAEQLYTQIKNQTSSIEKINMLTQVVKLNIKHIKARLLLSNTLLQLGLSEQARTALDQSLILFPQNLQFINLRSQLFLQSKQAKSALVLMQQIDSNYINDEIYLSLLASAYQQTKKHTGSLKIYQKLLKIDSENAKYWLGAAIAHDNIGQNQQAISAYQQALNKNTLQTAIVSYINQRISALK